MCLLLLFCLTGMALANVGGKRFEQEMFQTSSLFMSLCIKDVLLITYL